MTWDPEHSAIIFHVKILSEKYVSDIPLDHYRDTAWDYALYGLAPCPYYLYIFCKFGVVPLAILSSIAILLAALTLKDGRKEGNIYS